MKIRCGSHQQNRSIVRPGLSLMAAKVALTAEEFRENSQRSIALFNTEKLSTNSTHVLKSAYCNSVHFCRCNLHGACGGKVLLFICAAVRAGCNLHGACGGKEKCACRNQPWKRLQSARSVWRQRSAQCGCFRGRWLQSARSVWRQRISRFVSANHLCCNLHGACGGKVPNGEVREYV